MSEDIAASTTGPSLFESLCNEAIADLSDYAGELKNEIDIPDPVHIAVGISDSTDVSASASWNKTHDFYQINFSRGLCAWAFDLAVYSSIHLDQDFTSNLPRQLDITDYSRVMSADDLDKRTNLAERMLLPHKKGFCRYLFGTFCLVVFAHELAHIINGHIDYLKSHRKHNLGLIDELHIAKQSEKTIDLPLQLLEFEADFLGSRWLVELALGKRHCPKIWRGYTAQQNLVMGLWAFVLFTIAIEEAVVRSGFKTGQYPEPMLRFTTAVSAMNGLWNKQVPHVEFQEEVFYPVADLLKHFEPLYPAIDYVRNFADEDWASAMKDDAAKLLTINKPIIDKLDHYRLKYI